LAFVEALLVKEPIVIFGSVGVFVSVISLGANVPIGLVGLFVGHSLLLSQVNFLVVIFDFCRTR
jgi:hypothetical protein